MSSFLYAVIVFGILSGYNCRYVDMSHKLFPGSPKAAVHGDFNLTQTMYGPFMTSKFIISHRVGTPEHTSTHLDAPYHYAKFAWKLDQIPFANLHGPGVVLDIRDKVEKTAPGEEATVDISDAEAWENKYGRIPKGAIVVMNSGWSKHWPDANKFVGSEDAYDLSKPTVYPGMSGDLARWLLNNREIVGVASDTISCDRGSDLEWPVHNTLLPENIWCAEMVTNIDRIPVSGAELFFLPMKIREGSGAPARVFAMWKDKKGE